MSVIIPKNISIIGVYTSNGCFILSFYVYEKDENLCYLLRILYILSILNWSKMYSMSIIKLCDITTAIVTLYYITIYSTQYYTLFYKNVWNYSLSFSLITFFINNIYFFLSKKTTRDCYINVISHITIFHIYLPLIVYLSTKHNSIKNE